MAAAHGSLAFLALALAAEAVPPANAPPPDVAVAPRAATRLPSGLAMRVLARGAGRQHPKDNDCVLLRYTMWRRDGAFLSGTGPTGQPQNQCL
ncbi:MAG TPA: hypothetical protein VMU50_00500, partial [Polyangia bacterium]|nr:hypothetical protein [Polyangia bacterium]